MGKAERTRQHIIEKTASLFNTKGYAATSISDVLQLTGLTKGSIYGNFTNKDEIVEEVFKYNVSKLRMAMKHYISKHDNARDQLLSIVDFYNDNWKNMLVEGGCPLMNAATEADDNLTFLKGAVKNTFQMLNNTITEILDRGIREGAFKKDIDSEEYAAAIVILVEGGILLGRVHNSKKKFDVALGRVKRLIEDEVLL